MKAVVILTPSESKRLIAKGVVALDVVKKALQKGWVVISVGSTCTFVLKEILGDSLTDEMMKLTTCGVITPERACISSGMAKFMSELGHAKTWILEKGKIQDKLTLSQVLKRMGKDDVFIKGANALDPYGEAAAFLASPTGGSIGVAYGPIKAKGINLIIPVGFEKTIPYSIHEVSKDVGIETVDYSMGLRYGMIPMEGSVVTERTALRTLAGVDAYPIGGGGVKGAEGSVVLLIKGDERKAKKALKLIQGIKEDKTSLNINIPECSECSLKQTTVTCW